MHRYVIKLPNIVYNSYNLLQLDRLKQSNATFTFM